VAADPFIDGTSAWSCAIAEYEKRDGLSSWRKETGMLCEGERMKGRVNGSKATMRKE
jgi:hypothetical protein